LEQKVVMEIAVRSYKFFENRVCKFFPCHNIKEINCLFCFCPWYHLDCKQYGGNPFYIGNTKCCQQCILPHEQDNYDKIINVLK